MLPIVTLHDPVVHEGAIWQTFPQAPQLLSSFWRFAQTFWVTQAVSPPAHVKPHAPLQVAVPLTGAVHGLHVGPHLFTSSSAAHSAPHAWKLVLHVKSQVLFAHVATPLSGVGHFSPHAPQLLGFPAVSTH